MADVNAEDAKNRFEELVRKAEQGEVTTITRDGQPVADLVPHPPKKKGGMDWEAGYRYMRENGIDFSALAQLDLETPLPEDFLITPLPDDFDEPPKK